MLVSFHKTSPSPSLWSEFALVGLSTLKVILLSFYLFALILFTEWIIIAKNTQNKM